MATRTLRLNLSADVTNFTQNVRRAERNVTSLTSELRSATTRVRVNTQLMLTQLNQSGKGMQSLRIRSQGLSQTLQMQSGHVARLQNELTEATTRFGATSTQVRQLELNLLRAATAEQRMRNELRALNDEMTVSARFSRFGESIRGVGTQMTLGVTLPTILTSKKGIDYNAEIENYITSFQVLLDDTNKAKDLIEDMQDLSIVTPFQTKDLARQSQTLLTYGVELKNVIPLLKMLGDASLGQSDKFEVLSYNMAQVIAKGRLMGDDARSMTQAGFNPIAEISAMTGKSISDLTKEMEKGKVSAEIVLKAMQRATSEGGRFFNSMEKQSKTFAGQWSTISEKMDVTLGTLTKPLFNFMKNSLFPMLDKLLGKLQNFAIAHPTLTKIATSFIAITAAVGPALIAVYGMSKIVGWATAGFALLNSGIIKVISVIKSLTLASALGAIKMIAIGASVVAFAALSYVVVRNWDAVGTWFKAFFNMLSASANVSFANIKQGWNKLAQKMAEGIEGFGSIFGAKTTFYSDYWKGEVGNTKRELNNMNVALANAMDNFKTTTSDTGKIISEQTSKDIKAFKNAILGSADMEFKTKAPTIEGIDFSSFTNSTEDTLSDASTKIINEMKDFVNKLKSQAEKFRDALGLFDKATMEKLSPSMLLNRLRGQLNIMKTWKSDLDTLKQKLGGGSVLYQKLLEMGPQAAGQIAGIRRLSDTQLQEYSDLFAEKGTIAGQIATQNIASQNVVDNRINNIAVTISGNQINSDNVNDIANQIIDKLKLAGVY